MSEAAEGHKVRVHYTGTLEDGVEFDSSRGRDPLEFTVGAGEVIAGFDRALLGMTPGESKTVTIAAGEAYGERDDARVHAVPRSQIPPEVALEVGGEVMARDQDGNALRLRVLKLEDERVVLDANHPLAGETLTFEIELLEIV